LAFIHFKVFVGQPRAYINGASSGVRLTQKLVAYLHETNLSQCSFLENWTVLKFSFVKRTNMFHGFDNMFILGKSMALEPVGSEENPLMINHLSQ
jgi:hypothetical protein